MNFLIIKFFPSKIEDYLYFCVSNIILITILLGLIELRLEEKNKNENISDVMLFIPKIYNDFEEKRDLIFNQLSANSSIISLNKLENKEIKKLLSDILKNIKVSDDILPEVYDVQIEQSKPLNLDIINNKITKIIDGALIDNISNKRSKNFILSFYSITVLVIIMLLNNFFLLKNYLVNIKNYINLSRYFGVNDFVVLRNLNFSFFVLITLVFSISYPISKVIIDYYLLNDFIKIYLLIYFLYNFIILIILSILCKIYMKNLNVL
tara:strand:+ start:2830 stop:3624 length:795 start_codon:yes stop_codon:yes gene_type:complete